MTNNMNYGVLLGRKETDYLAGTLPYEERNKSGNWYLYCPPGEWQGNNKADSMSCVTFSALNSIETQERFLTGKQVNYSDRWIAKMSGTTKQGNYLYKVVDAIREFGLVREEDYPTPQEWTWEEYMADIPEPLLTNLKEKGKKWLEQWDVSYEWLKVNDWNLDYHLKHAPLQVVIPGHAIEGIYSPADLMDYFDSYNPYFKNTPVSNLQDALKIVLTRKENMDNEFVKTINIKGAVGLVILADTIENLKFLSKAYNKDITINPDGSILTDYKID